MGVSAATPADAGRPRRGRLVSARLLRVASDERLVALVRDGSQPAFEVVYDRHHRGILAFCRHMLGSREEAEDAVQHTFMSAYRSLLGSDQPIQLRAWLYAIARNRCLSVLRARRERPADDLGEPATEGLAAEVQRRADLQDMLSDLAALPEDQRAALVLAELGALPHEEIASVIGCPKDKVKALVFQARTSLQQSREARETSCQDIRAMLSELRGGSLRRTTLRRHLKDCAGCREFEAEVKRQRRAMAAILPVVPTLGLKESALASAFGAKAAGGAAAGGLAAAGATAGGTAAGGAGAVVAKVLVVATVATGGAAGIKSAADGGGTRTARPAAAGAVSDQSPEPKPALPAAAGTVEADEAAEQRAVAKERRAERAARKRAKGERGEHGRELARSRGKGKKHGLLGTQPRAPQAAGRGRPADPGARGRDNAASKKARREGRPERKPRPAPKPRPVPKAKAAPKPDPAPRATPEKPAKPAPAVEPEPTAAPTVEPEPGPTDGGASAGRSTDR